jgi:SagB-type dehydrogenase family enzyme
MTETVSLHEALSARRSVRDFTGDPVPLQSLVELAWAAQGVTAGDGRRSAPSAHALYPLQMRLIAGKVDGLAPGLYDVGAEKSPKLLKTGDRRTALQAAALEHQPWVGSAAAVLAFCADMDALNRHFAEQPPRGARGTRYAFIEAGAAAQNALLQAAAAGLGAVLVAGFDDAATAAALGLDAPLAPLLYLCLGWPAQAD